MSLLSRVGSTVSRHPVRSIGVLVVVALTLGVFLVLSQVNAAVVSGAGQAVSSVQNIVTVQLAGNSFGGGTFNFSIGAGVTPGTVQEIDQLSTVASVQRITWQPEFLNPSNPICGSSSDPNVQAIDTTGPVFLLLAGLGGATTLTMNAGRTLSYGDEQGSAAVVGSEYASDNGLRAGSPLSLNGATFTVVGIFNAPTCAEGGETVIAPFPSGTSALGTTNATIVYAYLTPKAQVSSVVSSLQHSLGSGYNVQSLANANHEALRGAVSSILASSETAQYVALVGGALVVVTTMVVVTSRRTREFGLMKALGHRNSRILAQVSLESFLVALLGLPAAFGLALLLGPAVAEWAVGGAAGGYAGGQLLNGVQIVLTTDLLLVGLAVTLLFGVLGAIYPSIRALRLPPTEALRDE
ncbi:MAG TPA: ABC transporter permease [Thermoplasmata archaeon]|nr:ABC transporter permease [Thermoplasmata archaeon]